MHLGLKEFLASELVHIIALIGATFLRQRASQMRVSSKRPRVEFSSSVAPLPPSSSDPATYEFIDPVAAAAPPPFTLDNSEIRHRLDTVMTV